MKKILKLNNYFLFKKGSILIWFYPITYNRTYIENFAWTNLRIFNSNYVSKTYNELRNLYLPLCKKRQLELDWPHLPSSGLSKKGVWPNTDLRYQIWSCSPYWLAVGHYFPNSDWLLGLLFENLKNSSNWGWTQTNFGNFANYSRNYHHSKDSGVQQQRIPRRYPRGYPRRVAAPGLELG